MSAFTQDKAKYMTLPPNPDDGSGCGDDDSGGSSWVTAVILCVVSAFVINFGVNLQKLAWNKRKAERQRLEDLTAAKQSTLDTEEEDEEMAALRISMLNNADNINGATVMSDSSGAAIDNTYTSLRDNSGTIESALNSSMESSLGEADGDHGDNDGKAFNESHFRSMWVLGFACIVVGSLFDFAALAFGAQSIVAPLGSTSLVANMIFAQQMLGESLTRKDLTATAVIFAGCVLSVTFASHDNDCYTIDTLLALYSKPRFGFYASAVLLALFLGIMAVRHMETVARTYGYNSEEYAQFYKYHRFSYTFLSGLAGAQSILFAKSLDELLVASFKDGGRVFLTHFGSYLIAICMFTSVALQIFWLNCALAHWDALYVVPVFQAQWIVFNVIGGGVFYGEFNDFSFGQAVGFCVGITFTVLGVYVLSQRGSSDEFGDGVDPDDEVDLLSVDGTESLASGNLRRMRSQLRRPASLRGGAFRADDMGYNQNLDETLDTPLLDTSHGVLAKRYSSSSSFVQSGKGTASGIVRRSVLREYDVTFDEQTLGLSVDPVIARSSGPSSSAALFNPDNRPVKLWRVRASRFGSDHPVKVGHVIVAANGVSIVGPDIDIQEALDRIVDGPRPITLRFRSEPTDDPPYTLDYSAQSIETGSAAVSSVAAQSAPMSFRISTPGSTRGAESVPMTGVVGEDLGDEGDMPMAPLSNSLQGATLNPLLELIHSWKDTGPTAYDRLTREDRLTRTPRSGSRGQATGERSMAGGRESRATSTASAPSRAEPLVDSSFSDDRANSGHNRGKSALDGASFNLSK